MQTTTKSFREKSRIFLSDKRFILSFIAIISLLMFTTENIGQLIGFAGILIILWANKWDWSYFSWYKSFSALTVIKSLLVVLVLIIIVDIILTPLFEIYFSKPIDLSNFDGMRGNILNLLISIIIMWVIAAIGEELLFRGFIMKRIAMIFGDTRVSWIIALLFSSIVFGFAHLYQGAGGVITTIVWALILGIAYMFNKKNLLVCILAHGIYDTFGLIMIYLNLEGIFTDVMKQLIY